MTEPIERIESALFAIPPDDRDTWVKVGMAIESELGDLGFDLWDHWSQQAGSYRPADTKSVWRSFKAGSVTIRTLFKLAIDNGWRDDKKQWPQPDAAAVAESRRIQAERAEQGRQEALQEQIRAADWAGLLLQSATPARADHPYLVRKGVAPTDRLKEIAARTAARLLGYTPQSGGEPLQGRLLLDLIWRIEDGEWKRTSIEMIDEQGRKAALAGRGTKAAGFVLLESPPPNPDRVVICEGIATALSIRAATGQQVVCALSCSNLKAVAEVMRKKYPQAVLVLAADLLKATGQPDHHAADAARVVSGLLAVPSFSGERQPDQTDFNDLHQSEGLEAVCACLERAKAPEAPEQPNTEERADSASGGPAEGLIEAAIDRLKVDAGAVFVPHILDLLRAVRATDPAAWARYRQAIKTTGKVAMADLDRLTAPIDDVTDTAADMFDEVTPWSDPVDGANLLDEMTATIKRYVIADDPTIRMAALWSVMTWFMDVVSVSPFANITAPEKRCGKTVLLGAIGRLSYRPIPTSNIAPAALYRGIELWHPTLLIDEADSFLRDNEEMRGILNSGLTRDTAFVYRCVGDENIPTKFSVWAAKVLCGIGQIADTLRDRSIPLVLRRKLPAEKVANLRHADPQHFNTLCSKLARWSDDNREAIRTARPATIDGLNDRANDCMEPLLAIAEVAGGNWPEITRRDALHLYGLDEEPVSSGVELLTDIKAAFDKKRALKLFTGELLEELIQDTEAPWATWNRGKALAARQLARKLEEFKIKPNTIRIGDATKKGYHLDQFKDAFKRYIPTPAAPSSADTPNPSVTPSQPSNCGASSHFASVTPAAPVTDTKPPQPSNGAGCDVVTDKNTQPAGKEAETAPPPDDTAAPAGEFF